jgi:hypothetical protein
VPVSPESWLAAGAFALTAAIFTAMAASGLFQQRWVRRLPSRAALGPSPSPLPRVSIIVAARDEAAGVEASARTLLAQRDVTLEVIVVNDRSVDATSAIVRRLAAGDSRLRVIDVATLPDGWLGKCHACHVGAAIASGDWILFTDADCRLPPDVVARALDVAARAGVDHVALTPGPIDATLGAKAWHLVFVGSVGSWIAKTNRDVKGAHVGIGAFNLVRAAIYRAGGGHEALRLTVIDDIRLGLLVRRAGGRTRGFLGGDDAACAWATTVGEAVRLTGKNYFAAVDYRPAPAFGGPVIFAVLYAGALAGLGSGTWLGVAAGLAPLLLAAPAGVYARRLRWPILPALLAPGFYPVVMYAVVRSAVITLRQGGIRWRDTFYPLAQLRAGTIR